MPEVTLEGVSPFGVLVAGKWINGDKKAALNFKESLHPGDVVDLTQNPAGFITAFAVKTSAPPKAAKKPWSPQRAEASPETSARMARGAAIKAVLSSPVMVEVVKDLSAEEALVKMFGISEQVAKYIETGV